MQSKKRTEENYDVPAVEKKHPKDARLWKSGSLRCGFERARVPFVEQNSARN